MKKIWHIYAMQYYLAMSEKDILQFARIWMDREVIMLREIS